MGETHNYHIDKQQAIKEMLDMSKRATQKNYTQKKPSPSLQREILPSLRLPLDADTIFILAIILILYNDNTDILLIFALAYILL